jgi:hypothetical protein
MIEAAVFGSVVKVVDRFVDLLKYRQGKRKEFFTTLIEPLFNDLLVMHADYMKMFDDCGSQLSDNKVPLQQIAEALRQRRQVYEGLRIKSNSIIDGLQHVDLEPEIKSFLEAAAYHIPDGELGPVNSTPASWVLSQLYSASDQLVDTKGGREAVLDLLSVTVNDIRQRLAWICEEYVRVKVWALH